MTKQPNKTILIEIRKYFITEKKIKSKEKTRKTNKKNRGKGGRGSTLFHTVSDI